MIINHPPSTLNFSHGWSTGACPGHVPLPRNKGLIAGLIKGNQWLISPDHKAGYFWGGTWPGGVGWPAMIQVLFLIAPPGEAMETELILPATGGGNQNLDTPVRPLALYLRYLSFNKNGS